MRASDFTIACCLLATAVAAAPAPVLTPQGFGPIRIGMSERAAAKTAGVRIAKDDGVDTFECRIDKVRGQPGVYAMAERGVITMIGVREPSRVRTDRGLGLGSREAEVRRAYGPALKVATAAYLEEPAHDLTFWEPGGRRGILYETDDHGRVTWIRAGSRSIELIEGCS